MMPKGSRQHSGYTRGGELIATTDTNKAATILGKRGYLIEHVLGWVIISAETPGSKKNGVPH
jgi:hypothetical protein